MRIRFDSTPPRLGSQDQITDYSYAANDIIDLSAIISASSGTLASYVSIVETSANNAVLKIDQDGSGSVFGWNAIAQITGVSFGGSAHLLIGGMGAADVVVGTNAMPDLVIDSISAPLSVVQGASLNFSYVVKNSGGTQAGVHWSGIMVDQPVDETHYLGDNKINSLAAGGSITFNNSIGTAGLSVGQHTLYIKEDYWYNLIGESNEGNNGRSITFNVTAGLAAPTITSFSNDSGAIGDGITNDNTLALTGSAQANSTVRVYDGATLLGTVTANGSGAWNYTSAALPDGSHSFTATATVGVDTSSASAALSVTIDTVAPGVPTITSFSNDSGVVGDGITNDNTLALTGSAQANSTVRLYDGATLLGSATANGSGAWSYTTAVLADGAHNFTATASDAAGNISAASAGFSVTIDTTPPGSPADLVIDSISAPLSVVQGASLNFSYVVKNSGGTQAGVHWSGIMVDQPVDETHYLGDNKIDSLAAGGSITFNNSIGTAGLSVGQHTLYIKEDYWYNLIGESNEGNNGRSITFNVTAGLAAPTITSFSNDSGAIGDGITNDNTLALTGSAQANSTVRVYDGATLLGTVTANGSGAWNYTSAALPDGSHSFTATATVGVDTSSASAALSVTIDTVAPGVPTITSFSNDSGVVGDGITNDNTLALTGSAQANSTVRLYDGATLLGSATANGSGAWSYTTAVLADGAHNFTATASDAAGNISAASAGFSVTIDTTPPGSPADLVIDSISAPLSVVQGASLNFSYVVKNSGGTQAGVHWSGIMVDQPVDETHYLGDNKINSLAAGGSITFNNSIGTAGLSVGQHTLYIKEDYWYNLIGESNEGNNGRSITFNVTARVGGTNHYLVLERQRRHRRWHHQRQYLRPDRQRPGQQYGAGLRRRDAARHGDGERQRRVEFHQRGAA